MCYLPRTGVIDAYHMMVPSEFAANRTLVMVSQTGQLHLAWKYAHTHCRRLMCQAMERRCIFFFRPPISRCCSTGKDHKQAKIDEMTSFNHASSLSALMVAGHDCFWQHCHVFFAVHCALLRLEDGRSRRTRSKSRRRSPPRATAYTVVRALLSGKCS